MLRELLEMPGVEEICELRGTIGLMAFHGGNLERTTDAIAREVADRTGSSFYAVLQAPPLRKHIPSTAFRPEDSLALSSFITHVREAVAIHGYGRESSWWHLLLGGRNRKLLELSACLEHTVALLVVRRFGGLASQCAIIRST